MVTRINSHTEKPTALLLGVGYSAKALAPALIQAGYDVYGTTRSAETAKTIKSLGMTPLLMSLGDPDLDNIFETADIIVSSIPPAKMVYKNGFYDPVLANYAHLTPQAKWIGYLSATSVYGDRHGQWAFEGEPASPQLKRGFARAEAELEWVETGWPVHIFRLAGIYGNGRSPFEKLRNGTARAVIKDGHVVNRIHVEDIVTALLASINCPNPQAIYNLADGNPAPPQDVLNFAADLMGVAKPPCVGLDDASVSPMARTFYSETKRIAIDRAKSELGWEPQYPDYKSGLKAILDS